MINLQKNSIQPLKRAASRGFTLVEMMIIAPIVILSIGAFITLIINLTGEIMSSRGSNTVTYSIQNALNRIEEDIKLSSGFLEENSITFTGSNPQGRGSGASTTPFDAAGNATTGPTLILNSLVTDGNPLSLDSRLIYMANQPNDCSNAEEYIKNRPMVMNIIYFVENDTLWRRTVMPQGYDTASNYCGTKQPWQRPSCANGHSFCRTNDERLVDNVSASGFSISYFNSASSSSPIAPTNNTVLLPATTASVSITSNAVIAGRDIVGAGTVKASRLDTNASAVAEIAPPTAVPASPTVAYTVSDGHRVTYTWPRVPGATQYSIRYYVNLPGNNWSAPITVDNDNRQFEVTDGWNGDELLFEVTAHNVVGGSAPRQVVMSIPVWSPLVLKGTWTDYGNTYATAAYTRTPTGLVMFRGLIKNSGFVAGQQVVATIPQDYAPDGGNLIFPAMYGGNLAGRVDVNTPNPSTGESDVLMVIGDGGWVSLENIRYSKPSTRDPGLPTFTRTSPSFLNSWTNYTTQPPVGPGYAPASYAQDPTTLRVYTQGLIRSGTNTDGADMFMLPAALRPAQYQHIATQSTGPSGVGVSDSVEAKNSGSNSYQSVNTITYPSGATVWSGPTMVNGWLNYGGVFATVGFSRTAQDAMYSDEASVIYGLVSLKGLIRAGANTYDTTIFTLPEQYRPKNRIIFATLQNSMATTRLDILPNGQVRFMGNNVGWYSLDGITFLAEQ